MVRLGWNGQAGLEWPVTCERIRPHRYDILSMRSYSFTCYWPFQPSLTIPECIGSERLYDWLLAHLVHLLKFSQNLAFFCDTQEHMADHHSATAKLAHSDEMLFSTD